jgi:hypothetical protein
MLIGLAEGSTLGWVAPITAVATEVRGIGVIVAVLAITLLGMRVFMRRHLEDLGESLTAYAVGGALIGTAAAAAPAILGFTGAATMSGRMVQPDILESLGTVASLYVTQAPILIGGMWVWLRLRHG